MIEFVNIEINPEETYASATRRQMALEETLSRVVHDLSLNSDELYGFAEDIVWN